LERLASAIQTAGLSRTLLKEPARSVLQSTLQNLFPQLSRDLDFFGVRDNLLWVVLDPARPGGWYRRGTRKDPLDDAASWPLPSDIAGLCGTSKRDTTSAHDLLCAVTGSPDVLGNSGRWLGARAAAVVILVAVHTANTPVFQLATWLDRIDVGPHKGVGLAERARCAGFRP
jgi:hypothetical protein